MLVCFCKSFYIDIYKVITGSSESIACVRSSLSLCSTMQSPFESLPEKVTEENCWTKVSVVKAGTDMINVWSLFRIRREPVNEQDNLDVKTENKKKN